LRRDRRAFSAFYGAFGVLLVSAAVVGGVLATMGAPAPTRAADRALAQEFLSTLLVSEVANGTSLEQALASSCFGPT
jgi:hypothetical protein